MNTDALKMLWRASERPKQARLASPCLAPHTLLTPPRGHLRSAKFLSSNTDSASSLFFSTGVLRSGFKLARHRYMRVYGMNNPIAGDWLAHASQRGCNCAAIAGCGEGKTVRQARLGHCLSFARPAWASIPICEHQCQSVSRYSLRSLCLERAQASGREEKIRRL